LPVQAADDVIDDLFKCSTAASKAHWCNTPRGSRSRNAISSRPDKTTVNCSFDYSAVNKPRLRLTSVRIHTKFK